MKHFRYLLVGTACAVIASTAASQEKKDPPKPDDATVKTWADKGADLRWLSVVDGQLKYDSRPLTGAT